MPKIYYPNTPEGHLAEIINRLRFVARRPKPNANTVAQLCAVFALADIWGIKLLNPAPLIVDLESLQAWKQLTDRAEKGFLKIPSKPAVEQKSPVAVLTLLNESEGKEK